MQNERFNRSSARARRAANSLNENIISSNSKKHGQPESHLNIQHLIHVFHSGRFISASFKMLNVKM
jgi:hypothetical protein